MCEWPSIVPKRLQRLAQSCFVRTRGEWLLARRDELKRTIRWIDEELRRGRS